ncbi:hypothetical protein GN244_ATG06052 [Phytophthora infestans]|uniref:Bzip transcription factor n=1 Tax=Phytophthora infestans TaxID=4787 RepID=A0A833WH13_PHYIN|nr:hypothetical protein GN244_ATG06052 [Phytophthora infestans]KAF4129370.1 hypothetical protein GN958_ATG21435 [Phytophthora infestans]
MTGSKPEATRDLTAYEATARQAIEERSRMRALRRERQIRYRKKKHDYMLRLEAETRILREQIKNLTQQRSSLSAVDSEQHNVWNVAVDYFKHFRFGLQAVGQFTTNSTIVGSVQLSFLRTALSPDVIFNTQQGIETIITHWRYITYAFQALEMTLDGLVRSVDGSLIAITRTSISISEHTLGSVFPHLCDDGDEDLNRLDGKLVGRRFHMLGVTRFEWSAASQRVSSVIAQSDMLTPMLRLLGDLEDVSRVFHKSRVSSDFQWNGTNH